MRLASSTIIYYYYSYINFPIGCSPITSVVRTFVPAFESNAFVYSSRPRLYWYLFLHHCTFNQCGLSTYFDSNFEVKNNQLSILIDEYYDEIYYPANKFEGFRKVINAAADFNKVTLILKPEWCCIDQFSQNTKGMQNFWKRTTCLFGIIYKFWSIK